MKGTIRETYVGIVIGTDDPQKRGRIRIKCAALTGDPEVAWPGWVEPVFEWGMFVVPDVTEQVEVEVIADDQYASDIPGQAFLEHPNIQYRGKRLPALQAEGARPVHSLFTAKNYGKRRGFQTPTGHVLMFDDTEGGEQVTLTWKAKSGDVRAHLTMDPNGSVILANNKGSTLYLNSKDGQVLLADQHGNSFSTSSTGLKTIDRYGNYTESRQAGITVVAPNVTVKSKKTVIDSGMVEVGTGADSPFVKYNEWKAYNDAHTHGTPFGPSSPPLVPALDNIKSITSKTR
jgi:hypothetical protein